MDIYQPICFPPLPNVLGGREAFFAGSPGQIYYTCQGRGEPLLLVHGINAGASNFEWRHNFNPLSRHFLVYALDLPGFARSDKTPTAYNAQIYITAITEFIAKEIQKPVHLVSSGLSAAYCSFIACNRPELVRSLTLVTPSGIESNAGPPCEASFAVFGLFSNPVQGDGIYNAFVSKPSIKYFLETLIYTDPALVTEFVVDYFVASSHQCPDAKYAPASFVAGFSNLNIAPFFGVIRQPILILWGRLAKLNPVENLNSFTALNPSAQSFIFEDSGLIPQDERAEKFNSLVSRFIQQQHFPGANH